VVVLEESSHVPADGLGDLGEQLSKFEVVFGGIIQRAAAHGLFHERQLSVRVVSHS
jgi:hypothetical protein